MLFAVSPYALSVANKALLLPLLVLLVLLLDAKGLLGLPQVTSATDTLSASPQTAARAPLLRACRSFGGMGIGFPVSSLGGLELCALSTKPMANAQKFPHTDFFSRSLQIFFAVPETAAPRPAAVAHRTAQFQLGLLQWLTHADTRVSAYASIGIVAVSDTRECHRPLAPALENGCGSTSGSNVSSA